MPCAWRKIGGRVKMGRLVSLLDARKKKSKTHTLESATVFPTGGETAELTEEQLGVVLGGMDLQMFSEWRARYLNDSR